jgi:hypothetical protein
MNNKSKTIKQAKSNRNKGLLLIFTALLALTLLSIYKIPLIHNELQGTIIGMSEVHDDAGSRSIATVHLDAGEYIQATMPLGLEVHQDIKARVMVGRTIFGVKSYEILSN